MNDGLREKIVELSVVAAIGGGGIDLEQRLGFGAADGLILDRGSHQDFGAQRRVVGIQRA
jgi:hypothetical protein